MAGIREDAIFVVKLAKYGPCSSSPMRPGGCSPMGPIPRRAELDDASGGSVRAKERSWAVFLGTGAPLERDADLRRRARRGQ
jgi:hypothetical protein